MATGAPTPTAARGAAVGLVTAAGAVWAHHASGGTVDPLPGLLAVLVSVAAGVLLVRVRSASLPGLLVLAGATQVGWHLQLSSAADPGHGAMGHGSADLMLVTHVGAGLLSAALALGADRALVRLARAWLSGLLVPTPAHPAYGGVLVPVAAPVLRAPAPPAAGTAPVRGPPVARRPSPLPLAS